VRRCRVNDRLKARQKEAPESGRLEEKTETRRERGGVVLDSKGTASASKILSWESLVG